MTFKASPNVTLDPVKLQSIIQSDGILSQALKSFEPRQEQLHMLKDVAEAYNHNKIALIEAGTGIGKSIAYLIPALIWALKTKERTVISTNTINLQEQLIEKDIPMLLKVLNLDLKAVLVKGMGNYLCLRKLEEAQYEKSSIPRYEAEELEKITAWQGSTQTGSKSEMPFIPSSQNWERVSAEADTCNRNECPLYQQCYFFKARKEASEAQILVSNHHLLFSDLSTRAITENYDQPAILPPYSHIILDEAHNIEDVATEFFASRVTRMDTLRILARIASEKNNTSFGKLSILKKKLMEHFGKKGEQVTGQTSSIFTRLNITLPGERKDLLMQLGETFHAFNEFLHSLTASNSDPNILFPEETQTESRLRLKGDHIDNPYWKEEVLPRVSQFNTSAKRYIQSLLGLVKDIQELRIEKLTESTRSTTHEIVALTNRLQETCNTLERFAKSENSPTRVKWIETIKWKTMTNVNLVDAELDISKTLVNCLFSKFKSVVLCSATLTTDKKFNFFRTRLGLVKELLEKKTVTESVYDSPFNYKKQALLVVPVDMPLPDHPDFISTAIEKIWQAVQASRGNAFILFTSYQMLSNCHEKLVTRMVENNFNVLKQGDDSRRSLIKKFKEVDRSILFGTDSFWEGVDVVGEALRCVIIVKLPFKVPNEPLTQARTEAITAQGGNSFLEYSIPNAIVKFKQGFGRLIRNKKDRGCIVCLDSRLITKNYGKLFLNSLPECERDFDKHEHLKEKLTEFYRKTYYLVKS